MCREGEFLVNCHVDTEDDNMSEREKEEKNYQMLYVCARVWASVCVDR